MIKVSYFDIIIICLLLLFLSTINNTIYITKESSNIPFYSNIEHMDNDTSNDNKIKELESNIQKNTDDINTVKLKSLIIQSQNKIKELTNTIKTLTTRVDENKKDITIHKQNIDENDKKLDEIYNFKMDVKK